MGEFFGTVVPIFPGDGVVAGVLLNRSKGQNAGWLATTTAWTFAVMAGVYTARAIGSEGYVNPVDPIAQAFTGALSPARVPNLVAGELLGGIVGAILVWLVWGIGLSLGGPTGYAINPARDLAPRLAHALYRSRAKGRLTGATRGFR